MTNPYLSISNLFEGTSSCLNTIADAYFDKDLYNNTRKGRMTGVACGLCRKAKVKVIKTTSEDLIIVTGKADFCRQ